MARLITIKNNATPDAARFGKLQAWWKQRIDPLTGEKYTNDYIQSMIGDYQPGRAWSDINQQTDSVIKDRQ